LTYTTVDEVWHYAQQGWTPFTQSTFGNEAAFRSFITNTIIPRVEAHINAYCQRSWTDTIPAVIADVAARAGANFVLYLLRNKMGPLFQTSSPGGGITLAIPIQEILTPDLKTMLDPFKRSTPIVKSTSYKTDAIKSAWDET